MIRRRALAAGIATKVGNHSFRAIRTILAVPLDRPEIEMRAFLVVGPAGAVATAEIGIERWRHARP